MKNINCVAIFGYNNTRIYDVYKIKDLVKKEFNAELILIKEGITSEDLTVTPYCLDHKPEDPNIASTLKTYLIDNNLNLKGCLPFSDKGVIGAAFASESFNLFGDDTNSSFAMLDKNLFRELEKNIHLDPLLYKKPFFEKIYTTTEAYDCFAKNGPYFIKPTSEGNSRGCMKINSKLDLDLWIKNYGHNLKNGVICEEILADNNEYSFDGVAGKYWVTQKFTTSGAFRAEYQHIVPAPLSEDKQNQLQNLLQNLIKQLGSKGGAFHHEFFILNDGRVASVEPNRRPAGMWLWDLANWSFDSFNPWTAWINKCVLNKNHSEPINANSYSGVRGIISKKDGIIKQINHHHIEDQLQKLNKNKKFKFSILKKNGDQITSTPKDNSDFLAFVAINDSDYENLIQGLEEAEQIILNAIEL